MSGVLQESRRSDSKFRSISAEEIDAAIAEWLVARNEGRL